MGYSNTSLWPVSVIQITSWKELSFVLEHHIPYALTIEKYCIPFWCVLGIIGNLISARVWMMRRMRKCNNTALYLIALALSDTAFLILLVVYQLQYPWKKRVLDVIVWCSVWNMMFMMAQYVCVSLVLSFTTERFISVCHPFQCERFSRSSRSRNIIIAIVIISFLLAMPQTYFWDLDGYTGECQLRTEVDSDTFYTIWNWTTEILMFGVVPVIVLLLNVCVMRQIKTVGKLFIGDNVTRNANSRCTSTTITLLWISFYLIVTKLPVTILFVIQTKVRFGNSMTLEQMKTDVTWQNYFDYFTIRKIIEAIGFSHHACNIFIYFTTSIHFRKQMKRWIYGQGHCCGDSTNGTIRSPDPLKPLNII